MPSTLTQIQSLAVADKIRVSDHAYEELGKDGIFATDVIEALSNARLVEDYPDAQRGPTVLVLCSLRNGRGVHCVWGIHSSRPDVCVLITAYLPDVAQWSKDLLKRIKP